MTNAPLSGALRGAVDLSSLLRQQPPAKQGPTTGTVPSLLMQVTDASFSEVLELSNTVPVIVEFYGQGIEPSLAALIEQYGGRLVLATVDGAGNPQLVQAFQVQQVPTVAAIVGGRPLQLFVGMPAEQEVRAVLDQVLEVAKQNGVTGTVAVSEAPDAPAEPVEEPLPPHHQEAYDAIAAGDYVTAIAEYTTALAQNPRDKLAVAGLAQVSLLKRLDGIVAADVRSAASAAPTDVAAQLTAADLEVSGGHFDEAFARLLDLFPTLDAVGKDALRARLLDYFEIAGAEDAGVIAARRRLTGLLY